MKREIYIYSILGILTCFLIYIQLNFRTDEEQEIASSIRKINDIKQLIIDLNCNVYLMQGEGEHLLLEGPQKKISRIIASNQNGCVKISQHKKTFMAGVFNFLDFEENNINIYITVKDLSHFDFSFIEDSKTIKYVSGECIGLILSKGQTIMIESILVNSCV